MRTAAHRFTFLLATLALVGCGNNPLGLGGTVGPNGEPVQAPGEPGEGDSSGGGGEAGTQTTTAATPNDPDEISALLIDVIAPQLCPAMIGSFIGMPGEGGATGPESGRNPSVGRWWIRSCESRVEGGRLAFQIGGTGWTWVDRENTGFRIRQYLRFEAVAALQANIEIGYNRENRIASIWVRPDGVEATITPRGVVNAEATNVGSSLLGGLLQLTGDSASDRAAQQAEEEGSNQLRETLGKGFTVTFDVAEQQMDFMVGALERGQVPLRPYENMPGRGWQVNQRSRVWLGGVDVFGPIKTDSLQTLDIQLEEGAGAAVQAMCAADYAAYQEAIEGGGTPDSPASRPLFSLNPGSPSRSVELPNLGCPTLIMLVPLSAELGVHTQLRYRVADANGTFAHGTAAEGGDAGGEGEPLDGVSVNSNIQPDDPEPTPAADRRVRLRIVGAQVNPQNAAGNDWDMVGGEADVLVVINDSSGRELGRNSVTMNQNQVRIDHWINDVITVDQAPLRITVYDSDMTSNERIGSVAITTEQFRTLNGTTTLSVRSENGAESGVVLIELATAP